MVDIQRVNEYNRKLKDAKNEQSKIQNELEYSKRELNRLCSELSSELGVQVTIENIKEVYEQEMSKIERNLAIGEEILARICGGTPQNTSSNTQSEVETSEQPKVADYATDGVVADGVQIRPMGTDGEEHDADVQSSVENTQVNTSDTGVQKQDSTIQGDMGNIFSGFGF